MTKIEPKVRPKVATPTTPARPAAAAPPAAPAKDSSKSLEIKHLFAGLPDGVGTRLLPYYTNGVRLLNAADDSLLQSRYDTGQLLDRVQSEFGANGELATAALARAWGRGRTDVMHMLHVARTIREDELVFLKSLAGPTGRKLSWMHLVALASIANKASRRAMAQRAAREDLSYDELVDQIRSGKDEDEEESANTGGGRPFKIPKALDPFVDKSTRQVGSTLKYLEDVVLPHLKSKVEETPRDKITPKTLERLRDLYDTFEALQAKITLGTAQIHAELAILARDLGVEDVLPARDESADIVVAETPAAPAPRRKVAPGTRRRAEAVDPKRRR